MNHQPLKRFKLKIFLAHTLLSSAASSLLPSSPTSPARSQDLPKQGTSSSPRRLSPSACLSASSSGPSGRSIGGDSIRLPPFFATPSLSEDWLCPTPFFQLKCSLCRDLIFPVAMDEFFPSWLNHLMHTTVIPLQVNSLKRMPST